MEPAPQPPFPHRNFYVAAIYGLWTLISAAFALPAIAYLFLPPRLKHEQEWTEVVVVHQSNHCSTLNGLAKRQTRGWVQHFTNPQQLSAGSIMPAYKLAPGDMRSLVDYLFTLPE